VRLQEVDDLGDRRSGGEHLGDTLALQLFDIRFWDRPAYDHEDVLYPVFLQSAEDPGDEGHVGAGEDGDPDRVRVLLNGGLDDLLGRLVEACVDDLHTCVAKGAGDDLRAPIVAVQTGLRNNHANFSGHVGKYMEVRLTVIGSSPAWPNPGSAQSGYLVEGSEKLLLDCGPGVLGRLRKNGAQVDAVAITHFHLDHWGDLVSWAWLNAYGPEEHRIRCAVWVPPNGIQELTTFAAHWGNDRMFEEAFDLHEYEGHVRTEIAGFEFEAHRLPHYTLEAYGFRIREGDKLLAYSGDCAPTPELAELAHGADLFVCEATLAHGNRDGSPRGHLSAEEALAAADGPILLTHRPVELPSPEGASVAYDGLSVEI